MNPLIDLRNAGLRLLTGERDDDILNNAETNAAPLPATDLAAAIKQAMGLISAAAINPDGSRVDYSLLRSHPDYRRYRTQLTPQLRTINLDDLRDRGAQMAFWINLYNALVLDAVISLDVRRSVAEQLAGLSFFRRAAYSVGGRRFSCEDIEHGLLRANAGNPFIPGPHFTDDDPRLTYAITPCDPRIHFALNCASRSCPPIAFYDPVKIDAQLDMAVRSFIAADLEIDEQRGIVRISSIFDWYRADFGGLDGALRFIRANAPEDGRKQWLAAQSAIDLELKPYDWKLNQA
jgi:hypothetical protein